MFKFAATFCTGLALTASVQASLPKTEVSPEAQIWTAPDWYDGLLIKFSTKNTASFYSLQDDQFFVIVNQPQEEFASVFSYTPDSLKSSCCLKPLYEKISKVLAANWSASSWIDHQREILDILMQHVLNSGSNPVSNEACLSLVKDKASLMNRLTDLSQTADPSLRGEIHFINSVLSIYSKLQKKLLASEGQPIEPTYQGAFVLNSLYIWRKAFELAETDSKTRGSVSEHS